MVSNFFVIVLVFCYKYCLVSWVPGCGIKEKKISNNVKENGTTGCAMKVNFVLSFNKVQKLVYIFIHLWYIWKI